MYNTSVTWTFCLFQVFLDFLDQEKKTSESYFRAKLKEREFWQDLQLSGVLEFWKFEMGDRKYLLYCLWAEREWKTIPLPALKSYGWVSCDYSISSAPFVSELRLWQWNLEIWPEMSRSRAWQLSFKVWNGKIEGIFAIWERRKWEYFVVSNFILSNIYINDDWSITIVFHDVIGSVSKCSERSLADINK